MIMRVFALARHPRIAPPPHHHDDDDDDEMKMMMTKTGMQKSKRSSSLKNAFSNKRNSGHLFQALFFIIH